MVAALLILLKFLWNINHKNLLLPNTIFYSAFSFSQLFHNILNLPLHNQIAHSNFHKSSCSPSFPTSICFLFHSLAAFMVTPSGSDLPICDFFQVAVLTLRTSQVVVVVENLPANVTTGLGRSHGEGQPTPVFLPGKSFGQRSLVGYSS